MSTGSVPFFAGGAVDTRSPDLENEPCREEMPMKNARFRRFQVWCMVVLSTMILGYQASCATSIMGALQNEIEVLLAPEADATYLLIPNSFLYNVFGNALWFWRH